MLGMSFEVTFGLLVTSGIWAPLLLAYVLSCARRMEKDIAALRCRLEGHEDRIYLLQQQMLTTKEAVGRKLELISPVAHPPRTGMEYSANGLPPPAQADPVRRLLDDFKYGRCDYGEKSLCIACGSQELAHAGDCKLVALVRDLRTNGKLKAEIAKKVREEIERTKRSPGRTCNCLGIHPPGECPIPDNKPLDESALLSAEAVRGSSASPLANFFNFTTQDRNVRRISSTESFNYAPPFRIGQIVRRKLTGKLYRIMDIPDPEEVNAAEVYPPATGTTTLCGYPVYVFEPAVPVEGERWQWHACGNLNHGSAFDHEPTTCPPLTDKCRDVALERSAVEHGCLTPM